MKNLKNLSLISLFALLAIALFAGCGDIPGSAKKMCATANDCAENADGTKQACVAFNPKSKKGYCENTCAKDDDCSGGKCIDFGNNIKACAKSCAKDDDCGTGFVCGTYGSPNDAKGNVCLVLPCDNDTDCGAGKACDTATKACKKSTTTQPTKPGTGDPNKKCTDANVADVCGAGPAHVCVGGKCELRPIAGILIRSKNEPGTCTDKDKGADILGVEIRNSDGTSAAWGRKVGIVLKNAAKDAPEGNYARAEMPDGQPPGGKFWNEGDAKCPVKNSNSLAGTDLKYSATGCGGIMKLQLVKTSGTTSLPSKGTVRVYEFDGQACTPGSTAAEDKYDVYVCYSEDFINWNDYTGALANASGKCSLIQNEGTGITTSEFGK